MTNPLPDLYLSGDWFHENSDGYSICSLKPIKKQMLEQLPQVPSRHYQDAVLEMNGIEPPIEGLTVFATSSKVLVSWDGRLRKFVSKGCRGLVWICVDDAPLRVSTRIYRNDL